MDTGNPYLPAVIGAVSGAALGFIGGLISEPLRQWFFGPRLHIDSPDRGNIGETDEGVYIKVRVQNTKRRTVAKSCRAYLIAVHEIQHGEPIGQSVIRDSFQLPWSGYDFDPRDIPHGVFQFVDIAKFSKHSAGWVFATKPSFYRSLTDRTKDYRGTYRLTILAAGDGVRPHTRMVNVSYDGDWHQARVWEA